MWLAIEQIADIRLWNATFQFGGLLSVRETIGVSRNKFDLVTIFINSHNFDSLLLTLIFYGFTKYTLFVVNNVYFVKLRNISELDSSISLVGEWFLQKVDGSDHCGGTTTGDGKHCDEICVNEPLG